MFIRPSLIALILRFWVPLLLACGYGALRGGKPERIAAALILSAVVATAFARTRFDGRFLSPNGIVVTIDVALLLALALLAIFANRRWPILLAALHVIPILGHLARWLNPGLRKTAYALLLSAPQIPIILVLFLATVRHQQRLRRWGADVDWRRSSAKTVTSSPLS